MWFLSSDCITHCSSFSEAAFTSHSASPVTYQNKTFRNHVSNLKQLRYRTTFPYLHVLVRRVPPASSPPSSLPVVILISNYTRAFHPTSGPLLTGNKTNLPKKHNLTNTNKEGVTGFRTFNILCLHCCQLIVDPNVMCLQSYFLKTHFHWHRAVFHWGCITFTGLINYRPDNVKF